ncbi:MAG TPA: addiction module protein [Armatimonadota bacterium]|jgi:putative addiction module component (TIGR02574 family)
MDVTAVLKEVGTWPVEQRLQLMDAVWDSLDDAGTLPELTDAQRLELDRRIAEADAHPEDGIPRKS